MLKRISLRWRLTLLSSLLITVCCVGLTITLNISAFRMADTLEPAIPIQPAGSQEVPLSPLTPSVATREAKHIHLMDSVFYTLIAVFAGGVFTYYVAGKVLLPVRVLNAQVKNINSHNLRESLEVPPTKDELAELTQSFNAMTDKLAEAFAMQQRLSADAAHELRTPLAVLQTKLDVFRKKQTHTQQEYDALLAAVQNQVTCLRKLVSDLLEIANMEYQLEREEIALPILWDSLEEALSPAAEKHRVTLSFDPAPLSLWGDWDLLYRVFYNLIENAIKSNVPEGRVEIFARALGDSVAVTVSDTGIGVPDSAKGHIFEPFFRADKSRSREMGGVGLGLSLASSIVKKHNGTLSLEDNPGGGSRFTVTLPTN